MLPVPYDEASVKNYLKIMSGSSNPELAGEICDYLDCPPGRLLIERASNDNIKVKIAENVREDDVFVIQTPTGGAYGEAER